MDEIKIADPVMTPTGVIAKVMCLVVNEHRQVAYLDNGTNWKIAQLVKVPQ